MIQQVKELSSHPLIFKGAFQFFFLGKKFFSDIHLIRIERNRALAGSVGRPEGNLTCWKKGREREKKEKKKKKKKAFKEYTDKLS